MKNKISIPRIETTEQRELIELDRKLRALINFILEQYEYSDKNLVSKKWLDGIVQKFHKPEKVQNTVAVEIKQSFFYICEACVKHKRLSENRKKNYAVLIEILKRFEKYKQTTNKHFALSFENFTASMIYDFEDFMLNEHAFWKNYPQIYDKEHRSGKHIPKPRSKNTLNSILKTLKAVFLWAKKTKYTTNNPFENFSIEENVYGTPYYITIDERNKIYATDFSKRPALAVQRDIFVFQCLIGCRVSDLYRFTQRNIIDGAIEYIARKTKEENPVTVRMPLVETAKEIIGRYNAPCSQKGELQGERRELLPFISEQKYNDAIKEIFTLAGITRIVTVLNPLTRLAEQRPINEVASSHLARRTFVGNLYKRVKDTNLVSSLSGHKEGSAAFARYREIDDEMKKEIMQYLE